MPRPALTRGALLAVALVAACGGAPENAAAPGKSGPPAAGASAAARPLRATVLTIEPRKVPVQLQAVGRTEGSREIEVRARVNGILEKRLYNEGAALAAGAPLFQIDRVPFEIALAQARAAVAQEKARNEQAVREADRLSGLARERAISQREADDAQSNLKASNASLQAAQARVNDAELNLSYTRVTAPIGGITGRAQRSEGSLVAAGSDTGLLTTIAQADPIWVRFSVSETEFAQLRAAGERRAGVALLREDGTELPLTGRLNFTASAVDARLGTVQLRAEFANPKLDLLPGQFVRARLTVGVQQALLVPQLAVLQGDQGRYVWVLGADGKAAPRPVVPGAWVGRDWVITSGLKAGDRVIIDNLIKVRPGADIEAAVPDAPAAAPAAPAAAAGTPAGTAGTPTGTSGTPAGAAGTPAGAAAKPAR